MLHYSSSQVLFEVFRDLFLALWMHVFKERQYTILFLFVQTTIYYINKLNLLRHVTVAREFHVLWLRNEDSCNSKSSIYFYITMVEDSCTIKVVDFYILGVSFSYSLYIFSIYPSN